MVRRLAPLHHRKYHCRPHTDGSDQALTERDRPNRNACGETALVRTRRGREMAGSDAGHSLPRRTRKVHLPPVPDTVRLRSIRASFDARHDRNLQVFLARVEDADHLLAVRGRGREGTIRLCAASRTAQQASTRSRLSSKPLFLLLPPGILQASDIRRVQRRHSAVRPDCGKVPLFNLTRLHRPRRRMQRAAKPPPTRRAP
jgi:hypothetical protein